MTDEEVIQNIRAGGFARHRALRHLYEDRGWCRELRQHVRRHGVPAEDDREVVHDCFVLLDRNIRLRKYVHEGKLEAYCFGIARRLAQQYFKKPDDRTERLGESESEKAVVPSTPEDLLEAVDTRSFVERILSMLGAECRRLVRLLSEGYSGKEIVELTDLSSTDYVKTKAYRCRQKLREALRDAGIL